MPLLPSLHFCLTRACLASLLDTHTHTHMHTHTPLQHARPCSYFKMLVDKIRVYPKILDAKKVKAHVHFCSELEERVREGRL